MCCVCVVLCFFFFKQKTAYEMRSSDWSSDVCSSDLPHKGGGRGHLIPMNRQTRRKRHGGCTAAIFRRNNRQTFHERIIQRQTLGFQRPANEIGRASCRERVCQYV